MKKTLISLATALLFAVGFPVYAAETGGHQGHGSQGESDTQGMTGTDQGTTMDQGKQIPEFNKMGEKFHESKVGDMDISYYMMDLREKLKSIPGTGDIKITHHLMAYPTAQGKVVEDAKIGYEIQAPDGKKQTIASKEMLAGYGGDVYLKDKGKYTVQVRIERGSKTFTDNVEYEVK
jgi:hypothetical protein